MMRHFLDFERPLAELEGKIEELRHLSTTGALNIADEYFRSCDDVHDRQDGFATRARELERMLDVALAAGSARLTAG